MIETRHREDGGGVPDPGDQNGIIIKAEKNTSIEEIQLDEPIGIVFIICSIKNITKHTPPRTDLKTFTEHIELHLISRKNSFESRR